MEQKIVELPAAHGYHYGLLPEQAQEDALHATRLLSVEERPFQRVMRNLLGKDSLLRQVSQPTLSPVAVEDAAHLDSEEERFKRQKFREDIILDFAALESSILRIQLIQSSNQRERERYAAEKQKIQEAAQAIRDNTVELRARLEEAQRILKLRKGYDELASKILDDKQLRSREDCEAEIADLEKEIEDLRQESSEFEGIWVTRRQQFERIVAEGDAMVRLIKGIKDEPDTENDQDDNMEDGEENGTKGESSHMGTPGPDGRTPMVPEDARTPRVPEGSETPMRMSEGGGGTPARPGNKLLDIDDGNRVSSGEASPLRLRDGLPVGDVNMADSNDQASGNVGMCADTAINQNTSIIESGIEQMDET